MSTATKAPREKLTLRDDVELYGWLEQAIEDHIDEIELNGGALPDWLAAMLDEVEASMMDRVDAIAAKLDQLGGYVAAAKATKDRAARREKVWANTVASIKAYAFYEVQKHGGGWIRGKVATLRIQKNGQPSTDLSAPADAHQSILLAAVDASHVDHPLKRFITVQRVATLDRKALGAAYEARRAMLEDEASLLNDTDIPERDRQMLGAEPNPEDVAGVLADMRTKYVATNLAQEFPGVIVTRGSHLRID